MIETKGLSKLYSGVTVVDSIDMEIDSGTVFGLIGPNGAGKTTLINMIIGLIEPTRGKCFINGIDVVKNPLAVKKIIGHLPEGIGFYSNLSAKQNLKYFSKFYGMEDKPVDRRITELLEYVGLGSIEKPVENYSKGMKQRLGMAHALLNDPDILFMDEPTTGLDPEVVIKFRNIIEELPKKGKTVFFSSHNLEEINSVCNLIGIISRGKMIACGTPDEVRNKMRENGHFIIDVEVNVTMPPLEHPGIVGVTYDRNRAKIKATSDIRDDISQFLMINKICIREMLIERKSLEEIFIDIIYRGEL